MPVITLAAILRPFGRTRSIFSKLLPLALMTTGALRVILPALCWFSVLLVLFIILVASCVAVLTCEVLLVLILLAAGWSGFILI